MFGKVGWVPFADLHVQSMAVKENAEFTRGWVKTTAWFSVFVDPKFVKFGTSASKRTFSIFNAVSRGRVYHAFRRYLPSYCCQVAKSSKSVKKLSQNVNWSCQGSLTRTNSVKELVVEDNVDGLGVRDEL